MDNFNIKTYADVKVVEATALTSAGFINGFSTRVGGVSPFPHTALNLGHSPSDQDANVDENRRRFLIALGLQPGYAIATAKQVHSADSVIVKQLAPTLAARPTCDALLTNNPDLLLGIQTADCLPVLIVDPKHRAVAGIHAGWRGTLAAIVTQTINQMTEHFGTNPADCLAATGPAISSCCFEVGPEVRTQFIEKFAYGESLFAKHQTNGKSHMDLKQANYQQLCDSGLKAEHISIWSDCTLCKQDLYFSYRGESAKGGVGRLLSVVGLK